MKYKIVVKPRKNLLSVDIVCTHNSKSLGSQNFTHLPSPEWCCIEKQIRDKMHTKYIVGRTTDCRCRVALKTNKELQRAKRIIDKENSAIAEDRQGYAVAKRKRQLKEKLMNDPDSFFSNTLYESCKIVASTKKESNQKNLLLFNESISKRFPKWKNIKLREIYTQEFQDKWVVEGRKWVIEGQKDFKMMEGTSYERYTRNMKTIGNHFIKMYPEQTKGLRVPLTTYRDLHHDLRKKRHTDNINIRPLMDWELKMLEENMIQYRRDGKNNHDKAMYGVQSLNHKNPAYEECCRAFLYACRSGLRYKDIQHLKWHNIIYDESKAKKNKNYDHTLDVIPHKTRNTTRINVKLHFTHNVSRFLGKRQEPNDYVFPLLMNFKNADCRNLWYKGIGQDKFKDGKFFKFHSARDTLAYNLYNKGCADMVVAKALGDTTQTVQKHYASMSQEIVAECTMGVEL